ncbi:MAG: hypothetical protein ACREMC_08175 [Gemmatimonadales bacterium]
MSLARDELIQAIATAREHAKELLALLESQGHPETGRSSSVYLALVSVQKQVTKDVPHAQLVAELQQLVTLCEGRLASVRPFVEEALRVAGPSPK